MTNFNAEGGPGKRTLQLGVLLRIPFQVLVMDWVEPGLTAAGFGDVSMAHAPVLRALSAAPDGLRATELAAQALITKQSMGYLVEHLKAAGYIERAPDPTDGRAKVVRLTPRGWELIRAISACVHRAEADWAERIGKARLEELQATLQELVDSFERSP